LFYITVIIAAVIIITAINVLTGGFIMPTLASAALAVVAVIALDGIEAFIIRRLPEKWFLPESKLFAVSKKEARFYRRMKINKWKSKGPELGCFTGFHKDKLQSSTDKDYLARFLLESNYGVAIHIANALLGICIIFLPFCSSPAIAVPVAAVNAVLSLLPVMILRANTPALQLLYKKSIKK